MADFSAVGLRLPQQDAAAKATGQAQYADDLRAPAMLCGAVLRSPLPHARILHVDTSRARRLAGVRAVLTGEDTPKIKYGIIVRDELPLAVDRVRCVGDEVAAVVAVDEETAREALDLIRVEYEDLPAVFDPIESMQPEAPRIHEAERNIASHIQFTRGDVEQWFHDADFVFEDRYQIHAVHHCFVEPVSCLASYSYSGQLTIWAPTQEPFLARLTLSVPLAMPASRIRVIQTWIGGSFGCKGVHRLFPICALASIKTGRPVRFTNTRAEDFISAMPRIPMTIELKTGVKRDGTLLAKQTLIIADNGAYCSEGPGELGASLGRPDNLYRLKSVKAEAFLVYTNKSTTTAFRGYGNPQVTFAQESHLDSVAERLGMDPVELRLKNAVKAGDTTINGYQISSCGLEQCIREAIERTGWKEKKADRSPNRGIGIACALHGSGARVANYNGSTAIIKLNEDGGVTVNCGEGELGQGANTALSQIAAEVLGARPEDVRVAGVDTDVSPFGMGAWGSRVTFAAGHAVKLAAEDVRRRLVAIAAEKLEAKIEDIELRDSKVHVRGAPDRALTFAEVSRMAIFRVGGEPIVGKASYDIKARGADPVTRYGHVSDAYTFAAQVVEVEVDAETGKVKVLNVVSAHDIGRAINPMLVEGQIEGGMTMGLGCALTERLIWHNGEQQIVSLADYGVGTALDAPPLTPVLVETDEPAGPFGAKGIGEPPIVPVAAAVANAIYDAIGVRINELPLTPEKVLRAIRTLRRDAD